MLRSAFFQILSRTKPLPSENHRNNLRYKHNAEKPSIASILLTAILESGKVKMCKTLRYRYSGVCPICTQRGYRLFYKRWCDPTAWQPCHNFPMDPPSVMHDVPVPGGGPNLTGPCQVCRHRLNADAAAARAAAGHTGPAQHPTDDLQLPPIHYHNLERVRRPDGEIVFPRREVLPDESFSQVPPRPSATPTVGSNGGGGRMVDSPQTRFNMHVDSVRRYLQDPTRPGSEGPDARSQRSGSEDRSDAGSSGGRGSGRGQNPRGSPGQGPSGTGRSYRGSPGQSGSGGGDRLQNRRGSPGQDSSDIRR
jgi:hypothetical protein